MVLWTLLGDIAVLLSGSLFLEGLFSRFRQSALMGYWLADMTLVGRVVFRSWDLRRRSSPLPSLGVPCCYSASAWDFSWAA